MSLPSNSEEEKQSIKNDKRKITYLPLHIKLINENGDIRFNCDICKKTFKSRNQRYYHLYCDDINKSPHKCKICDKGFLSAYHLNYHQQTHKNIEKYKCEKCDKNFCRPQTLRRHLKEHENSIKYTCSKCDNVFKDKTAYLGHIQKHDNIFLYSCKDCNKNFTIKSNYKQHLLIHSEKGNFECNKCGKKFVRKSSLNTHLLRHVEQKNFICTECSKTFIDKKTLNRHKDTHCDLSERIIFKCSICGVRSKRKDNLIRHLKNVHPEENIKSRNNMQIEKSEKFCTATSVELNSINYNKVKNSISSIVPEKSHDKNQIIINSSVIRSIGNVEPVYIPNITSITIDNNAHSQGDILTKSISQQNESSTNNCPSLVASSKKPKKKYDPCEIYRKILLASNDEDSVTESEDINSHEEHSSCCIESNSKKSSERNTEFLSHHSNFAEIHWRKRTSSQYFLNL